MSHRTRSARWFLALCAVAIAAPVAAQTINPCQPPRVGPIPQIAVPTPPAVPTASCPTGDCVQYDITTQDECAMFDRAPTGDPRWAQGLSLSADEAIFRERDRTGWNVTAYRIQWSNGAWSEWYVAGVNDIDHKYNPSNRTLRRMWSYFADHAHQALACRPRAAQ